MNKSDFGSEAKDAETIIASSAAQCEWKFKPRRFNFQLGEITFGSVTLRSLTLSTHFLRLVDGPAEPVLPIERIAPETSVMIANSYPVRELLPRLTILPNVIRYVPNQYQRFYVDLKGTFDAYLSKFSSKSRATLRKKVRKFSDFSAGAIVWREYRSDSLEEFHRHAFAVSQKTYQARLLNSGLPELNILRDRARQYSDARAYLLFHSEKPIAYIFCPVDDGNLLYEYVGFDPDYHEWSPGTVLQFLALESLFAEQRFHAFDFTEGQGAHKEFFATHKVMCADIFYFPKTIHNYVLIGLHAGLRTISAGSARLLDRLGLKARIKKLIRATS